MPLSKEFRGSEERGSAPVVFRRAKGGMDGKKARSAKRRYGVDANDAFPGAASITRESA